MCCRVVVVSCDLRVGENDAGRTEISRRSSDDELTQLVNLTLSHSHSALRSSQLSYIEQGNQLLGGQGIGAIVHPISPIIQDPANASSIYPQSSPTSSHHPITNSTMSQTMLLTKPLSAFLAAHTTPQLHTLLLLSPTGKVLSSSSPSSASTLRTQATLACSLWTLYHPFPSTTSSLVASSLPTSTSNPLPQSSDQDLNSITIQLEFGIMCIRALKSGLLFVAIGPSPSFNTQTYPGSRHQQIGSRHTSPPSSPSALERELGSQLSLQGEMSGAASEAGSVRTERSVVGASIWGIRRQAEDLGRRLEGRLEGFGLSAGER